MGSIPEELFLASRQDVSALRAQVASLTAEVARLRRRGSSSVSIVNWSREDIRQMSIAATSTTIRQMQASITQINRVAATSSEAVAQQITELSASVEASIAGQAIETESAITHVRTVLAGVDRAMAEDILTLESQVQTAGTGLLARVTTIEGTYATTTDVSASASTTLTAANLYADSLLAGSGGVFIYMQPSAPSGGLNPGDLWFDSDDGNKAYRWDGSAWVPADDARIGALSTAYTSLNATVSTLGGTVSSHTSSITSLNSTVALKVTTFRQGTAPTATATGDLWYDTSDNNKLYRWNGSTWQATDDARITAHASAISTLQTDVSTINGTLTSQASSITSLTASIGQKIKVQGTAPSTPALNDLWLDTSDNNKTKYWDGSAWQYKQDLVLAASVTTEASARATADGFLSSKYTLTVAAGDVVTGMNITSSSGSGTNVSQVRFQANKFEIYDGVSTGIAPFLVTGGVVYIQNLVVDGSLVTNGTITTAKLNFTPVTGSNVLATINASSEGLVITGDRIQINGSTTFASGYNPTTKISSGGAAADINANATTISGGKITTGTIVALGTVTAGALDIDSGDLRTRVESGLLSQGQFEVTTGALSGTTSVKLNATGTGYLEMYGGSGVSLAVIRGFSTGGTQRFAISNDGNIAAVSLKATSSVVSGTDYFLADSSGVRTYLGLKDANGDQILTDRLAAISDPSAISDPGGADSGRIGALYGQVGSLRACVMSVLDRIRPTAGHGLIAT